MPSTILSDNGVTSGTAGIKTTGSNDGQLALQTTTAGGAATTALTIDTSQNVGIGTTSPNANGKLTVSGNLVFPSAGNGLVDDAGNQIIQRITGGNIDIGNAGWNNVRLYTQSTERMRIDSSGNVGIGTSSPAKKLDIASGDIRLSSGYTVQWGGNNNYIYADSSSNFFTVITASSERMRITSDGYFVVGNAGSYATAITQSKSTAASTSVYNSWNSATSGTRYHFEFRDGADKISRGNITTDGANTTYATSSDYRLKENVVPLVGALEKVAQLKPSTWTWKDNKKDGQGFIAHELAEVVPQAVTGEKDATRLEQYEVTPAVYEDVVVPAILDEEGNQVEPERTEKRLVSEAVMGEREVPVYQGVDTSFLVATLTAAIQELKAELDAAKDRIAALEAK